MRFNADDWPIVDRIKHAKAKTQRLVDHALYLLELHENNRIVVYSPMLSSQIPTSYAANAFNVFQRGLHQFEIVRLCALWDGMDTEKENIPTVIDLVDHSEVIEALAQETASHWQGSEGHVINPSSDRKMAELEIEAVRRSNELFGLSQAQRARVGLHKAIADSRGILSSPKLAGIMNLRDEHLAHSLSNTRRERKAGPIPPMKFGDEKELLDASLPIIEALYCWVNGCSFSLDDSRRIDRDNARDLWENCTFKIAR